MSNTNRPKIKLEESNSFVFNDQDNNITDKPSLKVLEDRITDIENRFRKIPKTTFELLSTAPIAFIAGVIMGAIFIMYTIWNEKTERKELKRDLVEYCDKIVARNSKELFYR